MENQENIEQKYMQFQTLQQQMQQVSEHLELLNQQNVELEISKNALEEIGKTEINSEILAPVANGIFLKANLKDNQKLVINVGSNTTVEKTVLEGIALLSVQKDEILQKIVDMESLLYDLNDRAMKIYQEVNESVGA